eukprot:12273851-Alexandrium_andersonii.AAC.1
MPPRSPGGLTVPGVSGAPAWENPAARPWATTKPLRIPARPGQSSSSSLMPYALRSYPARRTQP